MNQILEKKIIIDSKDQLKTIQKTKLDVMINQQFFYNTEATFLKTLPQIEETMRLASGTHNAKIKIMPPHPKIVFR